MSVDAPPQLGNPYVGPTSFRLGDPLYGREEERQDLLDLLIAERILLLYSPSGAGKTSLIQAALVPALEQAGFEVLPIIRVTHALQPRPGMPAPRNRYVLGTLLSLEEGVPPERQRPVAELATMRLRDYMAAHMDRDSRPGNEVLIFDQFEEVLTADPTDEAAKHAFFTELGEALRDRGHWALFSMREDFLAALDPYRRHIPTRFRSTFRLDLLTVPEALEAMRRPADRVGVDFTEEAAVRLVDDLRRVRVQLPGGGAQDALGTYVEPVQLQVACRLLWSSLPSGSTQITEADVEALGDVDQALADYYSDRVRTIAESTGMREAVIRDWFEEHLITPQGLRGQVLDGPEGPAEVRHAVLAELVDAHLVRGESRRQATWYELAHDRLIEPVRRDNAAGRVQHQTPFERAAALWDQEGRADRLLLLGADLTTAEEDPAVRDGLLNAREREFLESSRRADEQARREARTAVMLRRSTRRLWIAVALITLLAVATGVFLFQSTRAASRAQNEEVASRLLLAAQRNMDTEQPVAIPLALSGAEKYGPGRLLEHARDILYQAAQSPVSLVYRGQEGPTTAAAESFDGSVFVAAGPRDIRTWDRATGSPRERLALQRDELVGTLDLTRDGRVVVAGLQNGDVLVWRVGQDRADRWSAGGTSVWTLVLSPDGTRLATVSQGDPEVRMWDLDGHEQFSVAEPGSTYANGIAFSPDGRLLATTSEVPAVVVRDATSGAEIRRLTLPEEAWWAAFGTDPDSLVTVTYQAVTVWDLPSGSPRYPPFEEAQNSPRSVNSDLSQVLTVSYGDVLTYDLATGSTVAQASVAGSEAWGAAFDHDEGRVMVVGDKEDPSIWELVPSGSSYLLASAVADDSMVSAWDDGSLRVWHEGDDTDGRGRVVPGVDVGSVSELAVDARGSRVAAVTGEGEVQVWDVRTGDQLVTLPDAVTQVALTADGEHVVTADSTGRIVRWDAATGAQEQEVLGPQDRPVIELEVSPDGSRVLVAYEMPAQPPLFRATSATLDTRGEDAAVAIVAPLGEHGSAVDLRLPEATSERSAVRTTDAEAVTAAVFGPDGEDVVVGTSTGRVVTFDAASGSVRGRAVVAHEQSVWDLVAAPDGDVLITGYEGDTSALLLLDPVKGRRIRHVPTASTPEAAMLTEDGQEVTVLSSNGVISRFPLTDEELMQQVRSKVDHRLTDEECAFYGVDAGC